MTPHELEAFLPLGTLVEPYGKIAGVGFICGERYYFFEHRNGNDIAFMPATVIEPMARRALSGEPGEK